LYPFSIVQISTAHHDIQSFHPRHPISSSLSLLFGAFALNW
jgi:hypothetical protein